VNLEYLNLNLYEKAKMTRDLEREEIYSVFDIVVVIVVQSIFY
jgi:hypothetical protein